MLNHSAFDRFWADGQGLSDGDRLFSIHQSLWAGMQLLGCMVAIGLPSWIGHRGSYVLMVSFSIIGNLLYGLSDPAFFGHFHNAEWMAIGGR